MALHLHDDKQLIYEGTRVNLRAIDLEKRSGGTHRREIAEVADAVVILPMLDCDTVVLIRNDRFSVNDHLMELPAGTLEEGEDPAECAPRELTEETGYVAERIEKLPVGWFVSPGFCTEHQTVWLAEGLTLAEQDLDETEHIEVRPTPYADVLAMIERGEIRDAKTIAAVLYYDRFRRG